MTLVRLGLLVAAAVVAVVVVRLLDKGRKTDGFEQYAIPRKVSVGDFPALASDPGILLFTHADCRACNVARRMVNEVNLPVFEVDGRASPDLLTKYGIDGVPATLLIYKGGRVCDGWVGPLNKKALTTAIAGMTEDRGDSEA